MPQTFILTLSCGQRPGIVHAVSSFLLQQNCDLAVHHQFDDTQNSARVRDGPHRRPALTLGL